jgi:hypothetical protein
MDTVTILRRLWRFRWLVALMGLLSIVIALAVSFRYTFPSTLESRKYEVGVANARILVDTPESQVVDLTPKGSEALGSRANLLASLMVDGEIEQTIARKAGLKPNQIIGTGPAMADPADVTEQPTRSSFVLSTQVTTISDGAYLPIIEINTQAPTAAQAQRLATAAVDGLREFLDSKAVSQAIPDTNRLRISGLSAAQARDVTRGPRMIFSIVAMIFVFGLGCGAILFVAGVVRGLRMPEAERHAPPPVAVAPSDRAESIPADAEPPPPIMFPSPGTDARRTRHGSADTQPQAASWFAGGPPA